MSRVWRGRSLPTPETPEPVHSRNRVAETGQDKDLRPSGPSPRHSRWEIGTVSRVWSSLSVHHLLRSDLRSQGTVGLGRRAHPCHGCRQTVAHLPERDLEVVSPSAFSDHYHCSRVRNRTVGELPGTATVENSFFLVPTGPSRPWLERPSFFKGSSGR